MQNTIIEFKQKDIKTRHIVMKGIVDDGKLTDIVAKVEKEAIHPDDVLNIIEELGIEVIDGDTEGCYECSEFRYWDDRTADESEEG